MDASVDRPRGRGMAVLFISRGTVCGVQNLVDQVCESTGARCLSREDLIQQVHRYGDWATTVVRQLSQATSAYEEFSRTRRVYIVLMRQALLERIQDDHVIYHGLSGHMLVPRLPHFIRIRITEPFSAQLATTMERRHCDKETARQEIRETESQQVRWARFMYGRDIRDPTLYDLNINVGHFTAEMTSRLIGRLLTEDYLKASPETTEEVARLRLASDVEVALVMEPRTREYEISASVDGTHVTLDGPYLNPKDLEAITEVARRVVPDLPIQYIPGYALTYRLEERSDLLAVAAPSDGSTHRAAGQAR